MSHALKILIEQSEKRATELASQMQQIQLRHHAAKEKKQTLESYRHDYAQRYNQFATDETRGRLTQEIENFMSFLAKLDEAIRMADRDIFLVASALEKARDAWNQEQKKGKAYQTLMQRQQQKVQKKQDQQLQKNQDEFAMRKYFDNQQASIDEAM
ncbi:flagellar export protein FliJ [Ampullimonas aquatilis]|uniref:flagellar export protein FliJ n=1 Tax=Ampullimonas aquatilis TaxID=1341549 RepID=UPI003C7518F3